MTTYNTGQPIAAAIGVVLRRGEVLLVRRANPPDVGRWGFPGGKINKGETIAAAATREVFEETGVRVEARQVFTAVDVFDRREGGRLHQHFILLAVLCNWLEGVPTAGDDALEAAWFPADALPLDDQVLSLDVHNVLRQAEWLAASRNSCLRAE